MKIVIKDMIGENCITMDDGKKVYVRIFSELRAGSEVELDFTGVEVIASPFLNAAIGHLLKDFKSEDLNRLLTITSLSASGMEALNRVIENSKSYYTDRNVRKALDEILTEQAKDK